MEPKIQALAAQPRTAWASFFFVFLDHRAEKAKIVFGWNVDIRDLLRVARRCVGNGGRCSVSGQKMFIQRFPLHAQRLVLDAALAMIVNLTSRRFQKANKLSVNAGFTRHVEKDIGMGVTDFALACVWNQWLTQCVLQ